MSILCKLGIHQWTIVHEGSYTLYGDPDPIPRTRGCTRCFKQQEQSWHLLGMNPIDYYKSWITTHKE